MTDKSDKEKGKEVESGKKVFDPKDLERIQARVRETGRVTMNFETRSGLDRRKFEQIVEQSKSKESGLKNS